MSVPIPALLELNTPDEVTPWVYTFSLQNEDGSAINGTMMDAHVHFWNEERTVQYGACAIDWISRNPAVIEATAGPSVLASIGDGNTGFGDLLIVNGGRRQYLVRIRLTVGMPD
jgi:hypothetical protein